MRGALVLILACEALSLVQAPARAQAPRAAAVVSPDTVTVGDRFRVGVRVSVPPGWRVEWVEHLPPAADVDALGAPRTRTGPGGTEHAAEYPGVAWRPGALRLPPLPVRVRRPGGTTSTLHVPLPAPFVRSVLPEDTTGVVPRGAKDVLDAPPRPWLLWAALAAGALLLLALLRALVRRLRRPRPPAPVSVPDARAWALAELERARRAGLVERGEWKELYARTSGAVRGFVAALSPEWGTELTTEELLRRARGEDPEEVARLAALLREADLVKFARAAPGRAEAERHWAAARAWVEAFQPRSRAGAEAPLAETAP
jgi:hypothetical protein